MLRSFPLAAALTLVVLASVGMSDAEACCGPNRAPEFFRHQYHAFRRGQVPGYLHGHHHHRKPLLGATR